MMSSPEPHPASTFPTQKDVIDFLSNPSNYLGQIAKVERIDTHGAILFLAGNEVWKIKRDIRLPYMDFSTLDKRYTVCCREVELNRQTAPSLYLGVAPISCDSRGVLNLKGHGKPVEWAVHMKRFDQAALLENVAIRGDLNEGIIRELARHVAQFHARLTTRIDYDFAATVARIVEELVDGFRGEATLFSTSEQSWLAEQFRQEARRLAPLLRRRSHQGFVRRCHGDLHLRNIVLLEEKPVLFDALEFDEDFATTDVLYDLAFAVMDLWHRDLRKHSNLLLNRYLVDAGEPSNIEALAALPLFLAIRAGIRAMVAANKVRVLAPPEARRIENEARSYFQAATGHLRPVSPKLVAIGGLSGTGKSTLAAGLAHLVGACPGALHLRSDIERKTLAQVAETTRLPIASYDRVTTKRVYEELMKKARVALEAGRAVIVDAVFSHPAERMAAEQLAADVGCSFQGFWLSAPPVELVKRVSSRQADASDADAAVVEKQLTYDVGELDWVSVDASGTPEDVARRVQPLLEV
jgi:aminoglycoside phosphotransferase family enzyme/predicted kinase